MSSALMAGLEMLLVLGSVLGLAVFELWRLRRDRQKPTEPLDDTLKKTTKDQ